MYIWRIEVENGNSEAKDILISVNRTHEYLNVKKKATIDV